MEGGTLKKKNVPGDATGDGKSGYSEGDSF